MSITSFGLMIESLVAVLLLLTIGYCVTLNRRLERLRADEQSLKATIAELITATEIAERAVSELKRAAHENDATLGERLRAAERLTVELERQVTAGDIVLTRLSRVVVAARSLQDVPTAGERARCRTRWRRRRGRSRTASASAWARQRRMTRLIRDFRIIPVVLIAISALFVLKSTGLIFNGGYTLAGSDDNLVTGTVQRPPQTTAVAPAKEAPVPLPPRSPPSQSWAQQMFNFPDVTGSVGETPPKQEQKAKAKPAPQGSAADAGRHADPARWRAHAVAGRARACWNGWQSGAASSKRAPRSSRCARASCSRPRSGSKPASPSSSSSRRRSTSGARQGRGRGRAHQESRHHVREHEAEGRRPRLRPARHARPARGGDPDQSAPDVRHPGPDVAGGGRAAHGRAGEPGARTSRRPNCPRSTASRRRIKALRRHPWRTGVLCRPCNSLHLSSHG